MKRRLPEFRSLAGRNRRPLVRMLIALALVAPAGARMAWRSGGAASAVVDPTTAAKQRAVQEEASRMRLTSTLAHEYRVPVSLADRITRAAEAESVHPRVAFELVRTESSFRRTAISSVGAVGLTQVMPATAEWLEPGTTRGDLLHPETNLRLGFRYLHYLLDRYDGDLRMALTAYNRGPGTVDRLVRSGEDPDNGYAGRVLARRSS